MCRFLVFKGADETDAIPIEDLLVKPSHSILLQSFQCRERCGRADSAAAGDADARRVADA